MIIDECRVFVCVYVNKDTKYHHFADFICCNRVPKYISRRIHGTFTIYCVHMAIVVPIRFSESSSAIFKSMYGFFKLWIMLRLFLSIEIMISIKISIISSATLTTNYHYLFKTDGDMCVIGSVVFTPLPLSNSDAVFTLSFTNVEL